MRSPARLWPLSLPLSFTLTMLLMAMSAGVAGAEDDMFDGAGQRSHKGKLGVHAQMGTGYRGILPYDDEYCGERSSDGSSEVCIGRSPLHLDVGISYATSKSLEVFLELRFGMETDFGETANADGPRVFHFAPGVKVYIRDTGKAKFFSTLQLVFDDTQYGQAGGLDMAIKNTSGLQLDVHDAVGVYVWFGEVVGWSRWLRFQMEVGLGMQARF